MKKKKILSSENIYRNLDILSFFTPFSVSMRSVVNITVAKKKHHCQI